jgi:tetratricopeptide (TPR) repeat protein
LICGQPGVGKTTLALRVAHAVRPSFPGGQLWAALAGTSARPRDPGEVLGELLRALGVGGTAIPDETSQRAALFRSRLAGRRILLVADDAASSAQVRPLLPGTAGSAVLVTSRTLLAGLHDTARLQLDPFTQSEAVSLLDRLVGSKRTAAEPEAVRELAGACGLMPLAVRIAGAKLAARPAWPVSLLARKMADERRRLDELEVEDLSVRASLALSYEALGDPAKRAFRLLGLLGPVDFADWAVAALIEEPGAAELVAELVDRCLLTSLGVDAAGQARYRLHDLLRDYANELLREDPAAEQDMALKRVLTGWLQLADLASGGLPSEPYFPPQTHGEVRPITPAGLAEQIVADPMSWFSAERTNLLTATSQASARDWPELAFGLAVRQGIFQHLQDRNDEAIRMWKEVARAAERAGEETIITHARFRYAAALVERGEVADTADLIDRCVAEFQTQGNERYLAFALYWRSSGATTLGDFSGGLRYSESGLAVARRIRSRHAECVNLRQRGQSLMFFGHYQEAIQASEQALGMASELGEPCYVLATMHTLAFACARAGQCERAAALSLRRLELSRQLGDIRDEGISLGVLGDAYHGMGRYQEAIQALSAALAIFRDHAHRRFHGICLLKLGRAYQALGQPRRAASFLDDRLTIFRELRLPHFESQAREALAACEVVGSTSAPGEEGRPGLDPAAPVVP